MLLALLTEGVLKLALKCSHSRGVGQRICLALVSRTLLGVWPAGEEGE